MNKKKISFLDVPAATLFILSVFLFSGCVPSALQQDKQDLKFIEFHVAPDGLKVSLELSRCTANG